MTVCTHCDEPASFFYYAPEDAEKRKPFCCTGCMAVYELIHKKGLSEYYAVKESAGLIKRRAGVTISEAQYVYLDDPAFLAEYSFQLRPATRTMEFYLEGIHCLACLWLVEKLPEFVPNVVSSRLNLERSVATVTVTDEGKFSHVARELNQLGHRPHPLKRNQSAHELRLREERQALLRIGVAGAAAGNIMLYAVSLYGGAEGEFAQLFNAITVVLGIPVFTYCAMPFYRSAWNALKQKTLSIDVPISLSLILGVAMGLYNLFIGVADNYFDSLTALVFLLLLSRYFLKKLQERGLAASDLNFFYQNESVLKLAEDDTATEVHPRFLQVGDRLRVRAGEFVPCDGVVLKGKSSANEALLSGESLPRALGPGDDVFAGTVNVDSELIVQVRKLGNDSRLGGILQTLESGQRYRSHIVTHADRVSKWFVLVVMGLALGLFLYQGLAGNWHEALERSLTLLIVTCPCALALAIPLTFTRALGTAAKHGIVVKGDDVLERLSEVDDVFLDKTGTLTYGQLKLTELRQLRETRFELESVILSLELPSVHPVARALVEHAQKAGAKLLDVVDREEIPGVGVRGTIGDTVYEIKKQKIFEDGEIVASFEYADQVRPDTKGAVAELKRLGLSARVLSGDRFETVRQITRDAGLPISASSSNLSPEQKLAIIKDSPKSLMVGDGANDSLALASAHVGVAVLGAMDVSLRAADVYLTTPGLVPVVKLVELSREAIKVIRRNIILSLCYNSISVVAAFAGVISPLIAAIVMPLSSLTVLISCLIGTKKLRNLWK